MVDVAKVIPGVHICGGSGMLDYLRAAGSRMEDGNSRSFMFESAPGYAIGDKVKVVDGRLIKG